MAVRINGVRQTTIEGDLIHTGTNIGLYSTAPAPQAAAIADPTGGAVIDVECRATIDTVLTALRAKGDIAT